MDVQTDHMLFYWSVDRSVIQSRTGLPHTPELVRGVALRDLQLQARVLPDGGGEAGEGPLAGAPHADERRAAPRWPQRPGQPAAEDQ